MNRSKRAKYNLIWMAIGEIVSFSCNLILPRLIISNYGSAYNGLISSVTQFLNFISILRLGVAGATRVALYDSLAKKDIKRISGIVKATEQYMQKIGYAILLFIGILSFVYPFFITKQFGVINTVLVVVAVGLSTFVQYFFGITYQTLLTADQRDYVYSIVICIVNITSTVVSSLLIIYGASIQAVKLVAALCFSIGIIGLNRYVIKSYHIDSHCKADTTALKKKNDVMTQSLANIIHSNTDIIILTIFCDINIVSVYTVYNLVMTGIMRVLNIFSIGTESIFGSMWAKGEEENIRKYFRFFEHMISMFIIIIFSSTCLLILPFVKLYTKNVADINYIIPAYAFVIILAQSIYCFRVPFMTLVQAAGHYKETKKAALAEAVINILISVILVQFLGIIGVAIGTLIANLFRTVHYIYYVSRVLIKGSGIFHMIKVVWVIFCAFCVFLICRVIFNINNIAGWGQWIVNGIFTVVIGIFFSLASSAVFYRDDLRGVFLVARKLRKS